MGGQKISEKVLAVHGLLKTELPVAAGICVVAGMIISGNPVSSVTLLLGFSIGFFLSGTAMITNDYWDLEVDKINHPTRPLPSGKITVNEVFVLAAFFSLAGISCATVLGLVPMVFSVIVWIIGLLYNWRYKESGLIGNMMVSFSVSSTFILGGIIAGGIQNGFIWVFGSIAFLFDLGEEISSGTMDVEGDTLRNVKSLARIKGRRFALGTASILYGLVILLTFVPYVYGWLGFSYLVPVLLVDAGIVFFSYKLHNSESPMEGRKNIRALYLLMVFFIIVVLIYQLV